MEKPKIGITVELYIVFHPDGVPPFVLQSGLMKLGVFGETSPGVYPNIKLKFFINLPFVSSTMLKKSFTQPRVTRDSTLRVDSARRKGPERPRGLKCSALTKCSKHIKRWTESWLVLRFSELWYYKPMQYAVPRQKFPLRGCSVAQADMEESTHDNTFKFSCGSEAIFFSTSDREEMESWITAIRAVASLHTGPVDVKPLKTSSESNLKQELTNVVSLADHVISLFYELNDSTLSDKPPLSVAEEIGSFAVGLANVIPIFVSKRSSQSVKQLCSLLVQIATSISELQKTYFEQNEELGLEELRVQINILFTNTSDLVSTCATGCDSAYHEHMQAISLIACKVITLLADSSIKTTPLSAEVMNSQWPKLSQHLKVISELALKVVDKTGNDLPTFIVPILSALHDDFHSATTQSISEGVTVSTKEAVDTTSKRLTEGFLKIVGLCKAADIQAIQSRSFTDKLRQASSLITDLELVQINEIFELVETLKSLVKQLDLFPEAIKSLDLSYFRSLGATMTTTIQCISKSTEHLITLDIGAETQDTLIKATDTATNVGKSLFATIEETLTNQLRNLTGVLRLCGLVNSLAEAMSALLRICLQITRSMKRKNTIFDPPPLPNHLVELGDTQAPDLKKDVESVQEEVEEEPDVNIWNEPADNPNNIVLDEERTVKCANLNKLVERLTKGESHDINLQKTFITTYRSFTTPEMFFKKLLQRFKLVIPRLPPSVSVDEYIRHTVLPVQLRIINVLRQWVEISFFDISDDLVSNLRKFIETEMSEAHPGPAKQLSNLIDKQIKERDLGKEQALQTEQLLVPVSVPQTASTPTPDSSGTTTELSVSPNPTPILPINDIPPPPSPPPLAPPSSPPPIPPPLPGSAPVQSMLLAFPLEELAQQLTYADFKLYSAIRPVELLNQSWSKKNLKHLAPHVLALSARFNVISNWVSAAILLPESPEDRTAAWIKLISLCDELFRLNNFNTLLSVLSGLNSSAIHRMKRSSALLPPALIAAHEAKMKLMNTTQSHHNYREALHNVNPPCLPYLGVYLTDLTFIEDGNKDVVEGLINFRKRQLVYNIISEIQLYQQKPYEFKPNMQILRLMHNIPMVSEADMWSLSLKREPRVQSTINPGGSS
ncbi:Ras guanine nucleotide exchange factor [Pelomyxa schiedti]|nr:Ras guanine nucleotide exchange factor [Pelomyxa schiedti]